MMTSIITTWKGAPVELVIDCSWSAVDAFIQEAYYLDLGTELTEVERDQAQEDLAGEIQYAAYTESVAGGDWNYSKR